MNTHDEHIVKLPCASERPKLLSSQQGSTHLQLLYVCCFENPLAHGGETFGARKQVRICAAVDVYIGVWCHIGHFVPKQQRSSIFENIQRRGASLPHVATRIPQKQPHPFAKLGVVHVAALLGQGEPMERAATSMHQKTYPVARRSPTRKILSNFQKSPSQAPTSAARSAFSLPAAAEALGGDAPCCIRPSDGRSEPRCKSLSAASADNRCVGSNASRCIMTLRSSRNVSAMRVINYSGGEIVDEPAS